MLTTINCIGQNAWNVKYKNPAHPNCKSVTTRFAMALYGGISGTSGKFDPYKSVNYVNITQTASDFKRYVVHPSGGEFDTFMHSRVMSPEIQNLLLHLYKPVTYKFESNYLTLASKYQHLARLTSLSEKEISRWSSISSVLMLIRKYQKKVGIVYSHIYLTRPDIGIWRNVDLRRYCVDVFYFNNCFPPFWQYQCQADFHFVFGQKLLQAFSLIISHFKNGSAHFTGRQGHLTNNEIIQFVKKMDCKWEADHVVVQRHEEVLRKGGDKRLRKKYFSTFP